MTSSALLVHLSGGYIEFHFHFFVMVGLLALYQDWTTFILAIGYVVVHEERRRRHQAEAGDHAAQSAWARQNARQHGRDADRARFQEDVRHLELPHGGEDGDADRVHPEQDEDAAVAAGPDALGQAPALGHETAKTRTNPTKRGRRRDEIHHAGYRSRHRASGPGSLSRE